MTDEAQKDDFIITSAKGFEAPKKEPDFKVHSITGVADSLKPDFEITGLRGADEEGDFIVRGVGEVDSTHEDDFTLHETRTIQPVRREMPKTGQYVEVGEIDINNIPVFIDAETFQAMDSHLSSLRNTQTPYRELSGAPIGRYCVDSKGRNFIEILAYVPFSAPSSGKDIEIPAEEWIRANRITDEISSKGAQVAILGWIHSHPDFTPAPSDTDIGTTNTHFNQPFLTALIYDPFNRRIGAYELDGRGGLRNKGGIAITGNDKDLGSELSYCRAEHL